MKKFILLYVSLFAFICLAFLLENLMAQYILSGFIIFQFIVSLGTFLLDEADLKEIYNNSKKIPLYITFGLDLVFISALFYFNQTVFGCLWFAQSFFIHNTYIKSATLMEK